MHKGIWFCWHFIIDNNRMWLAIAIKIETVGSIVIGFLRLDDVFNEVTFNIFAAEEVAHRC